MKSDDKDTCTPTKDKKSNSFGTSSSSRLPTLKSIRSMLPSLKTELGSPTYAKPTTSSSTKGNKSKSNLGSVSLTGSLTNHSNSLTNMDTGKAVRQSFSNLHDSKSSVSIKPRASTRNSTDIKISSTTSRKPISGIERKTQISNPKVGNKTDLKTSHTMQHISSLTKQSTNPPEMSSNRKAPYVRSSLNTSNKTASKTNSISAVKIKECQNELNRLKSSAKTNRHSKVDLPTSTTSEHLYLDQDEIMHRLEAATWSESLKGDGMLSTDVNIDAEDEDFGKDLYGSEKEDPFLIDSDKSPDSDQVPVSVDRLLLRRLRQSTYNNVSQVYKDNTENGVECDTLNCSMVNDSELKIPTSEIFSDEEGKLEVNDLVGGLEDAIHSACVLASKSSTNNNNERGELQEIQDFSFMSKSMYSAPLNAAFRSSKKHRVSVLNSCSEENKDLSIISVRPNNLMTTSVTVPSSRISLRSKAGSSTRIPVGPFDPQVIFFSSDCRQMMHECSQIKMSLLKLRRMLIQDEGHLPAFRKTSSHGGSRTSLNSVTQQSPSSISISRFDFMQNSRQLSDLEEENLALSELKQVISRYETEAVLLKKTVSEQSNTINLMQIQMNKVYQQDTNDSPNENKNYSTNTISNRQMRRFFYD